MKTVRAPLPSATERPDSPAKPAGVHPDRASAGTLNRLDAMVRTGERLAAALDVASREELCALADRFDLNPRQATSVLRIVIKRHLVRAGGRLAAK